MKKIFLLLLPFLFLFVSAKPAFAATAIQVVEFTQGGSGGWLARVFLTGLPPEAITGRNCLIYNSSHTQVGDGTVMNPTIGCQFGSDDQLIDGEYTIEILNQFNDVNNPLAISNTFYMINGRGSLVPPPVEPTPTPENLAPDFRQPEYTTLNANDIYYQAYGFHDEDSTSWTATIDYGDGGGIEPLPLTGRDFTLTHQYTTDGMYLVKLSVTDDSGNTTSKTGVVAVVPILFTPPSRTITNISYTYISPNHPTLVIEFTPNATFSSPCFLYVNGTSSRTATSTTNHSCTFRDISAGFDFTNLSLLMYNGGTPVFRTFSTFYTHTNLLTVTGMGFNNNAFFISTNILPISNNEACILTNAQNQVVATTVSHTPSNSCVFIGYGFNGPHPLPDGTYRLALNSSTQVQSAPFVITRPHRPEIAPLSGATINIGETYTENGSFTDPDSTSWTATVNFSNGQGPQPLPLDGTNFTISKQFDTPGTYNVIVSIKDDQNITNTQTTTVTVTDPQPVTVTFNASGDTYVRGGQDNHNYGVGAFMNIQSSGSNRSIVRFDQGEMQSSIGSGAILSAKLQVTIVDNGNNWGTTGRTVDVHRLLAGWDEGNGTESNRGTGLGATWSCASDSNIANTSKNCSGSTEWEMGQPNNPSVHPWEATATDTETITNNQTGVVEYDVTSDVTSFMNGTDNYGWLLKKTNEGQNGQVSFGTRESSSVPQLVVTYQP